MDVFRTFGKSHQNYFARHAAIEEVIPILGPGGIGGAVQGIDVELMNEGVIAEGPIDRLEFGGIEEARGDRQ